jgi:hypothetical protein
MSTARKTIDLHGQDVAEVARELATLPPGRYVLVPENEFGADADVALSAEDEAAVVEGLDEIDRGETVSWEDVHAKLEARLRAAGQR